MEEEEVAIGMLRSQQLSSVVSAQLLDSHLRSESDQLTNDFVESSCRDGL